MLAAGNMAILPAASALFLIRLRAVYMSNNYVKTFFYGCWLAVLGSFIFESCLGLIRCHDLSQCSARHVDAYGYIATAVYDTLIYLSISWQLASFARFHRWQDRLRSFAFGDGLGWLAKILLQSGQFYYLYVFESVRINTNRANTVFLV
jgi:chromate transport protein ChrA